MGKPKWQRARILLTGDDAPPPGFLIWVRCERPVDDRDGSHLSREGTRHPVVPTYRTNVLPWSYDTLLVRSCEQTLRVMPKAVELLARGPEDFSDTDPELVPWGSWDATTNEGSDA